MTYSIPEENLLQLKELMAKLNKRAAKLSVTPVSVKFVGTEIKIRKLKNGQKFEALYHLVEIEGTTPKLAGWAFVATLNHIDHEGEKLTVIKSVPGIEIPTSFRDSGAICDHCKYKRARIDTFVLQHDDGSFKQVGRNCLVDFLGGIDPQQAAASMEMLIQLAGFMEGNEEYGGDFSARDRSFPLREYLNYVAAAIRAYGWLSRTKARETMTGVASADIAMSVWFAEDARAIARYQKDGAYPEPRDLEMVEQAMKWADETLRGSNVDPSTLNDYQYNLRVATSSDRIDHRLTGISASLVYAYTRAMADKASNAGLEKSQFVGEVGKRDVFKVRVIRNTPYVNDWSSGTVVKALTADGNIIMWFDTTVRPMDQDVFVKGTIKKHNEYKGIKETCINRVAFLTDEEAQKLAEKEARKVAREAKKAAKAAAAIVYQVTYDDEEGPVTQASNPLEGSQS